MLRRNDTGHGVAMMVSGDAFHGVVDVVPNVDNHIWNEWCRRTLVEKNGRTMDDANAGRGRTIIPMTLPNNITQTH